MLIRYRWALVIIAIAAVTIALLPFASELPDGLERVAEMFSFAERERNLYTAPMRDYSLPWLSGFGGQAIAALVGIVIVSGLTFLLGKSIKRVRKP
jgi:hypothetical protein